MVSMLDPLATTHGTLSTLATVLIFPLSAILLRHQPNYELLPKAVKLHRFMQWVGYALYFGGMLLGITSTVYMVEINPAFVRNVHVVLGVIISILVLPQPILGEVHHKRWMKENEARKAAIAAGDGGAADGRETDGDRAEEKNAGRKCMNWTHLVNGRVIIFCGIINGGLGKSFLSLP